MAAADRRLGFELLVGLVIVVALASGSSIGIGGPDDPSGAEVVLTQLLSVVLIVVVWVSSPRDMSAVRGAAGWLLAIPVVGALLAVFSSSPLSAVLGAVPHVAIGLGLCVLVDRSGAHRAVAVVAASLGLLLAVSVPVALFGPEVDTESFVDRGLVGLGRFRGLMVDPNATGRLAAALLVLCAWQAAARRSHRGWWLAGAAFALGSLVATQSRTSWLAAGAGLAVLAIGRFGWRVVAASLSVVLVGVLLVGGLDPDSGGIELIERDDNPDELVTLTGRTSAWQATVPYIVERPLIGWGFNNSSAPLHEAWRHGDVSFPAGHAHNGPLNLGLSQGVVGLVLASAVVIMGIRDYRRRPVLLVASLVSMVAVILVTESLFVGDPGPLWVILALALALIRPGIRSSASEPAGHRIAASL